MTDHTDETRHRRRLERWSAIGAALEESDPVFLDELLDGVDNAVACAPEGDRARAGIGYLLGRVMLRVVPQRPPRHGDDDRRLASAVPEYRERVLEVLKLAGEPEDSLLGGHVRSGLVHGYPTCCIVFFVKLWVTGAASLDHARGFLNYGALVSLAGAPLGYMPCPRCLIERKTGSDPAAKVRP